MLVMHEAGVDGGKMANEAMDGYSRVMMRPMVHELN